MKKKIKFSNKEVIECNFTYCDRLIWSCNSIMRVSKIGKLVLKEKDNNKLSKIKESLKRNDNYIKHIVFYDEYNWSITNSGVFEVEVNDNQIIINSCDVYPNISSNDDNYYIELNDYEILDLWKITLDFENCEWIEVYKNEIKEMKLEFNEELELHGNDFARTIKKGYLKIELDDDPQRCCQSNSDKNYSLKQWIKRICSDECDICRLFMYDNNHGIEETILLNDLSEGNDDEFYNYFSGYAEKEGNDIIIVFGKKRPKL